MILLDGLHTPGTTSGSCSEMQIRGMNKKFGWDVSAKQYEDVYKNALLDKKR